MNTITTAPEDITLSNDLLTYIEQWKSKPGNLIMILHRVQEEYGYIPRAIAFQIADQLDIPVAKIYGVVTFYHLFKLKKPGRHQIAVCMGTACYLKGGEDLIMELERQLGTGVNTTTDDGAFSLEAVRCIGCCGLAPVMTIDGEVYGNVQKKQLPGILEKYKG